MKARVQIWLGLFFATMISSAVAQSPTLVSVVPANNATGVSTTTNVVFTFSTAMDTNATGATFLDAGFNPVFATSAWSAGDTKLTCSPLTNWPGNSTVNWFVSGQDTIGNPLNGTGFVQGSFTTGAGGGGGGNGTNASTSFTVGKTHFFDQNSTNLPTADPTFPYTFSATTSLASNRPASAVNLTLPTAVMTNLTQAFGHPELFNLFASSTNLSFIDSNYPTGTYTFVLQPSNSLTVPVNLPSALVQPSTPHISNYVAAQSVNPSNSFQLKWDPFTGGAVTDIVSVAIGTNFQTGNPGQSNTLNGTATSVTIPANTFAPNSNYNGTLGFYRVVVTTNAPNNYATVAYLATVTQFTLVTGSGAASNSILLTNFAVSNGVFSFDVKTQSNLTIRVDYSTNLATTNWSTLETTSSGATGTFRVNDTQPVSNHTRYFRGHIGP